MTPTFERPRDQPTRFIDSTVFAWLLLDLTALLILSVVELAT